MSGVELGVYHGVSSEFLEMMLSQIENNWKPNWVMGNGLGDDDLDEDGQMLLKAKNVVKA